MESVRPGNRVQKYEGVGEFCNGLELFIANICKYEIGMKLF